MTRQTVRHPDCIRRPPCATQADLAAAGFRLWVSVLGFLCAGPHPRRCRGRNRPIPAQPTLPLRATSRWPGRRSALSVPGPRTTIGTVRSPSSRTFWWRLAATLSTFIAAGYFHIEIAESLFLPVRTSSTCAIVPSSSRPARYAARGSVNSNSAIEPRIEVLNSISVGSFGSRSRVSFSNWSRVERSKASIAREE